MSGAESKSPAVDDNEFVLKHRSLTSSERLHLKKRRSEAGSNSSKGKSGKPTTIRRRVPTSSESDGEKQKPPVSPVIHVLKRKSPKKSPTPEPLALNAVTNYVIPKSKVVSSRLMIGRTKGYFRIANQRTQLARVMSITEALSKGLLKGDIKDVIDISTIKSMKNAKYVQLAEVWVHETTAIIKEACLLWQLYETNGIEFFFNTLLAERERFPLMYETAMVLYEPQGW